MMLHGHIQNGVVVFDQPITIPNGTPVRVETIVPVSSAEPNSTEPVAGDWAAALAAAENLRETGYDFDAWQKQRDYDCRHAEDHLP